MPLKSRTAKPVPQVKTTFDSTKFRSFPCPECRKLCTSLNGRTAHMNSEHSVLSSDPEREETLRLQTQLHPHLTSTNIYFCFLIQTIDLSKF